MFGWKLFQMRGCKLGIIRLAALSVTENIKIEKLQMKDKNSRAECLRCETNNNQ